MITPLLRISGLLAFFVLGVFSSLLAQDPIFTQHSAYKLYLNPAFTGYEPGINFDTGFRTQWHKVAESNGQYLSNYFGLGIELPNLMSGIGFSYVDNMEGEGEWPLLQPSQRTGILRYKRMAFNYAWRSWLCKPVDGWSFALGFSGALNTYTQDWASLVFSDQLDAIRGNVRPTKLPFPNGNQQSTFFYDFSAGGLMHWRSRYKMFRIGMAFHHIAPQDNSTTSRDDALPIRYTLHATGFLEDIFGSTQRGALQLIPVFKLDVQRIARENAAFAHSSFQVGTAIKNMHLHRLHIGAFYQSNHHLLFGNNSQNIQSLVLQSGYEFLKEKNNKNISFIWEVTGSWTHDLAGVTGLGDIFELSLNFSFPAASMFGAGCSNCKLNKLMQRF